MSLDFIVIFVNIFISLSKLVSVSISVFLLPHIILSTTILMPFAVIVFHSFYKDFSLPIITDSEIHFSH